jgi:hypothetical protein
MILRTLLQLFLPRRRTTETEVRAAMVSCGISPDDIAWTVGADGSFGFGRRSATDQAFTIEQSMCLLEWAQRERIKTGFIGWEISQP